MLEAKSVEINGLYKDLLREKIIPTVWILIGGDVSVGNSRPDIQIQLRDGRVIFLEPTWRSTGKGIHNEMPPRQNTLTVGHIQKYLLEKILGYVHDLGL